MLRFRFGFLCLGFGILVHANTGACPLGYCIGTSNGPTYSSQSCITRFRATYGGNVHMISGVNYPNCGTTTTANIQISLYKNSDDTLIDSSGTEKSVQCNKLDCSSSAILSYVHTTSTCPCAGVTLYYGTVTVTWYNTVTQSNCNLSGFSVEEVLSVATLIPKQQA